MLSFFNVLFTIINVFVAFNIYSFTHNGNILAKDQKQLIEQTKKVDAKPVLIKAEIEYTNKAQIVQEI